MTEHPTTAPPELPPELTVPELAQLVGLHPNTVRADIGSLVIARRVGGNFLISRADAAPYITARRQMAAAQAALDGLRASILERKAQQHEQRH